MTTLKEMYDSLPNTRVVSERSAFVKRIAKAAKKKEATAYRYIRGEITPGALERAAIAKSLKISEADLFPNSQIVTKIRYANESV
ncbi:MAG: hypothetical protein SNH28_07520 [Rikenellaceae bacterium]